MRLVLLLAFAAGLGFGQVQQTALDRRVEAMAKSHALSRSVRHEPRGVERICSIRLPEVAPLAEPAPMPEMRVEHVPVPMPIAAVPAPPCPK